MNRITFKNLLFTNFFSKASLKQKTGKSGFVNFSDGLVKFHKHEKSSGHLRAVVKYALRQAASESVSCSLGSERGS